MPTDSAQTRTVAIAPLPQGIIERASARARQFFCGLRGHDSLLHFERGRLSLMCVSCGHETPGWDVGTHSARREHSGQRSVVRVPLVGEQRAA